MNILSPAVPATKERRLVRRIGLWGSTAAAILSLALSSAAQAAEARIEFPRDFAPAEGWVKPQEKPFRAELCLNGSWQFQPVVVPPGYRRNEGLPPELPYATTDAWDATPIKIPSPWNVNQWGAGRNVGAGTDHPFWPDSVYFPSYPESWDRAEMGCLRRTFRVPPGWNDRRIVLHFEAVAGECQVWVNGAPAGRHFDKYLPFDLDVTRLVHFDAENELLVGVRAHSLFDKQSASHAKMRAPYPSGSTTHTLAGIWQDVFLLGLPAVRVEDVFVKPLVDQDTLELEVALRNDTDRPQQVSIAGAIHPWVNLAGTDVLAGPEPRWKLDEAVVAMERPETTVPAGQAATIVLRQRVAGRLKLWTPATPRLYASLLWLRQGGRALDVRFTRFGWRQFTIQGSQLRLNGQKIQLFGDLLHPFSPLTMSRRYAWAWYKMIRDFGGNAVRPHAQPHPRHYLDLADEMGIVVLDETAIFGSAVDLNFEAPAAWQRFAAHTDGLVLRDRNHPSVVGWSFGNELFAIFNLNQVSKQEADGWYEQLASLGRRARRLDPTRPWISCDGDEDLRGALPVWSKHFGHGTPLDRLPEIDKPLMVGESGGSYYARPAHLAMFNGPRAFEDYAGRNEALAIDVYDNIVRMARPRLAYYSASETAWFGLEHLNFGYRDYSRLPGRRDGVFFTRAFQEGKPGMQMERLPPYVATLNPGWDAQLPLYKPLAMFDAEKAALAGDGPRPCAWDHRQPDARVKPPARPPSLENVAFIGDPAGALGRRLSWLGVLLTPSGQAATGPRLVIVDAQRLSESQQAEARRAIDELRSGGTLLVMAGSGGNEAESLATILPAAVRWTDRPATALVGDAEHPWTADLSADRLYFAEDGPDRFILRHGMEGPLVERGRVLLRASDTDWSLFNDAPENVKCAAAVLYEHLNKPAGAALVEYAHGQGKLVLSTIDYRVASRGVDALWRRLLSNMGVKLLAAKESRVAAFNDEGTLIRALAIGRFAAPDSDTALTKDFLGAAAIRPQKGPGPSGLAWSVVESPSRDRFVLNELGQGGPERAFAVYFSYWVKSPRALDDLLTAGPDAPRVTTTCYVADKCRLWVNGHELSPTQSEAADYRTCLAFAGLPLKKGWNHCLLKVVSDRLAGDRPATLAVRIGASNPEYLRQIETAIEPQGQ